MYSMYIYICIGINVGLFQCCYPYGHYRVLPHIYIYIYINRKGWLRHNLSHSIILNYLDIRLSFFARFNEPFLDWLMGGQ